MQAEMERSVQIGGSRMTRRYRSSRPCPRRSGCNGGCMTRPSGISTAPATGLTGSSRIPSPKANRRWNAADRHCRKSGPGAGEACGAERPDVEPLRHPPDRAELWRVALAFGVGLAGYGAGWQAGHTSALSAAGALAGALRQAGPDAEAALVGMVRANNFARRLGTVPQVRYARRRGPAGLYDANVGGSHKPAGERLMFGLHNPKRTPGGDERDAHEQGKMSCNRLSTTSTVPCSRANCHKSS